MKTILKRIEVCIAGFIFGFILAILIVFVIDRVIVSNRRYSSGYSTVESLGVAGYNAMFETYFGENKRKAPAAGLVSKIIANNENNKEHIIYVTFISDISGDERINAFESGDLVKVREVINRTRNKKYTIKDSNYNAEGYINEITITQEAR